METNKPYKPSKAEINYWVSETMDHFKLTSDENKPAKISQLKNNLQAWERQLAEKTNDCFYESFPIGECNRELKTRYEAAKVFLKKIEKENSATK